MFGRSFQNQVIWNYVTPFVSQILSKNGKVINQLTMLIIIMESSIREFLLTGSKIKDMIYS
jgi:hypothetical protein